MIRALSVGTIFLPAGFILGLTAFGSALLAVPLLWFFLDMVGHGSIEFYRSKNTGRYYSFFFSFWVS